MSQEKFQYEWYTVDIKMLSGCIGHIFKAKNKENVIKQINRQVERDARRLEEKAVGFPADKRPNISIIVDWDTLTLDHVGYNRLF